MVFLSSNISKHIILLLECILVFLFINCLRVKTFKIYWLSTKRIKLGDVFEINTPKGKAYLHYIHKHEILGALIRVLSGLYANRPVDFDMLVSSKERYMIFFPLSAANNRNIVEWVSSYPVNNFDMPRFMRNSHIIRGEFLGWHIVDTETLHRKLVKNLTTEQKKLSPYGIWNDTLLIERLVDNWSLEKWS